MNKSVPWMKFYPTDWRGDAGLRGCSYAARGLWMDMLSLMHEATPYGHLIVNEKAPTPKRIAAMLGGSEKEVAALLAELEEEGVFSRTEDGVIYSRRMVADNAKAEIDRENGRGGGNPKLKPQRNGKDNGGVNPHTNPMAAKGDNGADKAQIPEARSQKPDTPSSLRSEVPHSPGDPDFDAFWAEYPRKVGKDEARKAFQKARKRAGFVDILTGLHRQRWPVDRQFVPHPATWLNGGRWQDDPQAAAPERQQNQPIERPMPESRSARLRRNLGLDLPFDQLEPEQMLRLQ